MTGRVAERILPRIGLPAPSGSPPPESRVYRDPDTGGRRGVRPAGEAATPVAVPAPRPGAPAAATARAARLARPRGQALLSTPARAGMLVGVSAAIYAVTLAAVAGLQSQSQADAAAQNQPAIDAVAQAKAANDALEAAIGAADARARALAGEYNAMSTDMTATQAQFAQLSALVAEIQGSAAKLNANFTLPTVTMHGAIGGGGGGGTVVTTTTASGKP